MALQCCLGLIQNCLMEAMITACEELCTVWSPHGFVSTNHFLLLEAGGSLFSAEAKLQNCQILLVNFMR